MRGQALTDTQLLLDLVGEAYGFDDLTDYRQGILDVITRVVPCDRVGYNEITPDESFAITVPEFDQSLLPIFAALVYENPLIERFERTRDGRPYRISDLVDQETFHGLALYKEFYRHIGVEWQVAFTLPARAPLIVGIALTRTDEDFTQHEVQLLALARPHLMQAYRNAELWSTRKATLAALEQGLDTLGQHIVVLDAHRRIEFATDGARRLLGDTLVTRRGLPDQIRTWITDRSDRRPTAEPLIFDVSGNRVLVRRLPNKRTDRREVLLLENGTGQLSLDALRSLGLTARESQTMLLIALGHTTTQTSTEMGIAARTLEKHLQHIYEKLGVRTLSEATATAWAAVGIHRPTKPGQSTSPQADTQSSPTTSSTPHLLPLASKTANGPPIAGLPAGRDRPADLT
jgi:DNA-binding CsgD family transcriptional regulator